MKPYTPEKLVAISRYQHYFPTLPEDVWREIYRRMEALIQEEREYCDSGNYRHMAQILTSIAMCEVLQRHGRTEAEAYYPDGDALSGRQAVRFSICPPRHRLGRRLGANQEHIGLKRL